MGRSCHLRSFCISKHTALIGPPWSSEFILGSVLPYELLRKRETLVIALREQGTCYLAT